MCDLLVIRSQKQAICSIFCIFFAVFPFFIPKSESLPSLFTPSLRHSFLKSHGSDSFSSLFTKEQPWGIRFFSSANGSFAVSLTKKQAIRSKNPRANSQHMWRQKGKHSRTSGSMPIWIIICIVRPVFLLSGAKNLAYPIYISCMVHILHFLKLEKPCDFPAFLYE